MHNENDVCMAVIAVVVFDYCEFMGCLHVYLSFILPFVGQVWTLLKKFWSTIIWVYLVFGTL
jgi:hypothetical protein